MSTIKKFDEYYLNEKEDKAEKSKSKRIENDTLSDNMSDIKKELENEKIIKLEDGEYEIVGINDISLDKPKDIKEAIIINAELGTKEVKRGDILWITAMLQKKNVNWSSMSVLKVRIQDMYQGLSILNTIRD